MRCAAVLTGEYEERECGDESGEEGVVGEGPVEDEVEHQQSAVDDAEGSEMIDHLQLLGSRLLILSPKVAANADDVVLGRHDDKGDGRREMTTEREKKRGME
jgi:hypothetical protein